MREVWRGYAASWECDELGHLNVRAYVAKAMEGVAGLAIDMGLAEAWTALAFSTLRPRDIHVRYLKECLPGTPLAAFAGLIDIAEMGALVYLELRHSVNEEPVAAFRIRLDHVSVRTGESFRWGESFLKRADAFRVCAPRATAPRGVDPDKTASSGVGLYRAEALGLPQIGRGVFAPDECTAFGWIRADTIMGRVSNSVVNFHSAFPEAVTDEGAKISSALLEARILMRGYPRAGAGYLIRSGIAGAEGRIRRVVHWILDPVTGRPWASMEGVAVPMDLETRRAAPLDEAVQAELRSRSVEGLSL